MLTLQIQYRTLKSLDSSNSCSLFLLALQAQK